MAKEIVKTAKKTAADAKAKVKFPDKFTAQSMANYISEKHGITKAAAKEMIEDVFDVISEGVMKGERVPVGKFGKLFIKVKPATKARMGRNPLTGEEIKIAAKKAKKVPKSSFSKAYKEMALKAKVKK